MKKLFLTFLLVICILPMSGQNGLKILSLNNSLVDFNNQPELFNQIAEAMGKEAHWQARTQLGRTLLYHYNDAMSHQIALNGDWDIVIMQEQSALPREFPEIFMQTLQLWKRAFIKKNGAAEPLILLPMNWGYSDCDSTEFKQQTRKLEKSYLNAQRDIPCIEICPVGLAYEIILDQDGAEAFASLYCDRMHPTLKASYLAACMEYAVIFCEDPESITYIPEELAKADADAMKKVASQAIKRWRAYSMISR